MGKKSIMLFGISIAFLNFLDGIATNYGLMEKIIEEMNPIMDFIISFNPALFLILKIALSLLVLFVSYWVYKHSKAHFQKLYLISLVGVFFLYFGICSLHLYWLSLL
ncbi:DUF5658 family protein [Ureibacillus sinduriensis]|uniref:DUF5658 domain-containing protein n=1 Tax=Ureibacillus sinduriensis BLB-1 = JCM 15800 TaxID=1384057 RepID=A0A0A3HSI3_9BACL|nr:DUF5658 family protein [Ureibacillus sinduriensis]KGR75374.1 hypothetical protein CD33_11665 [Ureibacillus sinduriensis BLB-1 = JCM 15800]